MCILVIGDYIVDKYIIGTCERLSPEAPVPVVTQFETTSKPGGAANVVENLQALGSKVYFECNHSQYTVKTRIVADNHIICRLDDEKYTPYKLNFSSLKLDDVKYAVLSDYNKGVLHDSQNIIDYLNSQNIKCLVDPKKSFFHYKNAWLIKANKKEFEREIGQPYDKNFVAKECKYLCKKYNIQNIIITLGPEGMFIYNAETGFSNTIYSREQKVIDVTGAGDVVIATLAHFLDKGENLNKAASIANRLAGISVSKFGTYTVSPSDFVDYDEKVVFTNGCFDILHIGHIELLKKSKQLGTKLIVGVNSDDSVKKLKGKDRPINNQNDRATMLLSLPFVDEVYIFDEDTPYELIKIIQPDIITKGGDYVRETVVGNDLADVVIIPLVEGYSTTKILEKSNGSNC